MAAGAGAVICGGIIGSSLQRLERVLPIKKEFRGTPLYEVTTMLLLWKHNLWACLLAYD